MEKYAYCCRPKDGTDIGSVFGEAWWNEAGFWGEKHELGEGAHYEAGERATVKLSEAFKNLHQTK